MGDPSMYCTAGVVSISIWSPSQLKEAFSFSGSFLPLDGEEMGLLLALGSKGAPEN